MRFLSNAPFDRFSLAIYPSDQNFLKASILRAPSAAFGGVRAVSAQGYVAKEPFESSNLLAMDFSRSGVTERVGVAFRAHVQWNDKGKQHAHGP